MWIIKKIDIFRILHNKSIIITGKMITIIKVVCVACLGCNGTTELNDLLKLCSVQYRNFSIDK